MICVILNPLFLPARFFFAFEEGGAPLLLSVCTPRSRGARGLSLPLSARAWRGEVGGRQGLCLPHVGTGVGREEQPAEVTPGRGAPCRRFDGRHDGGAGGAGVLRCRALGRRRGDRLNKQFSPGADGFVSGMAVPGVDAAHPGPRPVATFNECGAMVSRTASRPARAKSLNCARETVYEKTLRILMTADQNPARWRTEDSAGGDCVGSANGDGGTFSAFAREVGGDSRSKDGDVDLLPPQSNTLLSYFKRAPAATDTAMEVEDL